MFILLIGIWQRLRIKNYLHKRRKGSWFTLTPADDYSGKKGKFGKTLSKVSVLSLLFEYRFY